MLSRSVFGESLHRKHLLGRRAHRPVSGLQMVLVLNAKGAMQRPARVQMSSQSRKDSPEMAKLGVASNSVRKTKQQTILKAFVADGLTEPLTM